MTLGLCNELAKLDHAGLAAANGVFTLFRDEKFIRKEVDQMIDWLETLCVSECRTQ